MIAMVTYVFETMDSPAAQVLWPPLRFVILSSSILIPPGPLPGGIAFLLGDQNSDRNQQAQP
jgi:hypothetical protein